jgi:hypothetical protein
MQTQCIYCEVRLNFYTLFTSVSFFKLLTSFGESKFKQHFGMYAAVLDTWAVGTTTGISTCQRASKLPLGCFQNCVEFLPEPSDLCFEARYLPDIPLRWFLKPWPSGLWHRDLLPLNLACMIGPHPHANHFDLEDGGSTFIRNTNQNTTRSTDFFLFYDN